MGQNSSDELQGQSNLTKTEAGRLLAQSGPNVVQITQIRTRHST